jgi:hypothetical protein
LHYPINISSNSSGDIDSFVKLFDPERISLSLGFHPGFDELDNFLRKVDLLKKNKFDGCINFLAYPPFLEKLGYYISRFDSVGQKLKIIPFRGIYKENAYPWCYTQEEIALAGIKQDWFGRIRKQGTICYAGTQSAILLPDGYVSRCGQLWYNCIIGNFFEPGFKLLDKPQLCNASICPCDENILWGEGDAA